MRRIILTGASDGLGRAFGKLFLSGGGLKATRKEK